MDTINFLSTEHVLLIDEVMISMFGGASGIRDPNLLDSVILAPQATLGGSYVHSDICAMAANIMKNHPFFDGNNKNRY